MKTDIEYKQQKCTSRHSRQSRHNECHIAWLRCHSRPFLFMFVCMQRKRKYFSLYIG